MAWTALALKLGERQSHCSPLIIFMPLPSLSLHQPFIPVILSSNKTRIFVIFVQVPSFLEMRIQISAASRNSTLAELLTIPQCHSSTRSRVTWLERNYCCWIKSQLIFHGRSWVNAMPGNQWLGNQDTGTVCQTPLAAWGGRAKSTTIQPVTLCIPLALCTNYKLAAAD